MGAGAYKVVVVEDEPKILRNIVMKIEIASPAFVVEGTASNGNDAISVIQSIKPHVLLTDIKMPKMDGLELIKKVKNDNPHMQIIILSGYNEFEYAQQAIKLGVKEYLLKPVEENSLIEALNGIKTRLDEDLNSIEGDILYSGINNLSYKSQQPYLLKDSSYIMFLCINFIGLVKERDTKYDNSRDTNNIKNEAKMVVFLNCTTGLSKTLLDSDTTTVQSVNSDWK